MSGLDRSCLEQRELKGNPISLAVIELRYWFNMDRSGAKGYEM